MFFFLIKYSCACIGVNKLSDLTTCTVQIQSFTSCCFKNALLACSANSCLTCTFFGGFCGERVNCSNTLAEEAGLVAVRGLPDLPLCTSHTVPCLSKLSGMRAIVRLVGGCVVYSCLHCHTSTTFSNFKYHFKMVLRSLNVNRASTFFFDCPACSVVTLAFV